MLKNDFEAAESCLFTLPFGRSQLTFPFNESASLCERCLVMFLYDDKFLFLGIESTFSIYGGSLLSW